MLDLLLLLLLASACSGGTRVRFGGSVVGGPLNFHDRLKNDFQDTIAA
jgi:hypothetical protein